MEDTMPTSLTNRCDALYNGFSLRYNIPNPKTDLKCFNGNNITTTGKYPGKCFN